MEGLSAKMGGLELEAEAEVQDYGLPKDHPFTQPGDRIPIPMKLKSADNYKSAGGQLVTAPEDCYRTCASDPDPVVATFDGVISPEECAAVIALAQPKMSRAGVTTDDGRGGRQSSGRTNDSTWLPHDCSPTMWKVVQRISDLVGIPSENAEDVQVIHYTDGQEYRKHWDAYNPLNERGRRATASGGNRLITALAYLSEVEEGGGTGFINLRMEVDARAGRLLVFHNCYPGTRTLHVDSNHAGLPVVSVSPRRSARLSAALSPLSSPLCQQGDKWAFNLW